jgi:hypothetical protein
MPATGAGTVAALGIPRRMLPTAARTPYPRRYGFSALKVSFH